MTIHPNGVATVDGCQTHGVWCAAEGLVHDLWFAKEICKHISHNDVVVNAGANIGTLTRPMLDAGGIVYAFEPNKAAAECLFHNCPDAIIYPCGLSDISGWCRMHIDPANAGASWMENISERDDTTSAPCIALDDFTPLHDHRIKLMVADIEGHEVRFLRGARETIARCRPIIICEVNRGALERAGTTDAELFELLDSYGYNVRILQPECRIGDAQFDVECLPK